MFLLSPFNLASSALSLFSSSVSGAFFFFLTLSIEPLPESLPTLTPAAAAASTEAAPAEEKKEEEEEEEEDVDMSGGGLFGDDDDDW